jgi:hypothetical protein
VKRKGVEQDLNVNRAGCAIGMANELALRIESGRINPTTCGGFKVFNVVILDLWFGV